MNLLEKIKNSILKGNYNNVSKILEEIFPDWKVFYEDKTIFMKKDNIAVEIDEEGISCGGVFFDWKDEEIKFGCEGEKSYDVELNVLREVMRKLYPFYC